MAEAIHTKPCMFWAVVSLELDDLTFLTKAHKTSWNVLLLLAILGLRRRAGLWDSHHSPEDHLGFKANLGGPERGRVLLRSIYSVLWEVKCMVFKAALCPIAVPAKAASSETESVHYTS